MTQALREGQAEEGGRALSGSRPLGSEDEQAGAARQTGGSDSEIVAAIVAGDPAGLAEAYDRYAGPLYSFCRAILHEPADAADVVQDTFVIAAPRMSSLRDPARLRSWLYTVARNECLRKLRYASLTVDIDTVDEVDLRMVMESAESLALAELESGVGPAVAAVRQLPPRQRRVLTLTTAGLSIGGIASLLGTSDNAVRVNLHYARRKIKILLDSGVLTV